MRKITEGYMPFLCAETYYRIVNGGDRTPVIMIHGGPGSTHNYFELLDPMADEGRDIIMYDQIGCGNSYVDGRPELWKAETWMDELDALITHLGLKDVYLLGQSWGGMLVIQYMIERRPEHVRGIILSSTLSSASLWSHEQHRRISFMSQQDQDAIRNAEETGNWNTQEAILANTHFMERHCAKITDTDPECLTRPKKSGAESYLYGWGPNEYTPQGTLKDFEYTDRLHEITVPALVISGTNDLCSPLVAKTMHDRLNNSTWELFDGCRHMCFAEDTEHYINVVNTFLKQIENRKSE
ncbi:MAG: proline iminopeptidase [Bulleidia sp.]